MNKKKRRKQVPVKRRARSSITRVIEHPRDAGLLELLATVEYMVEYNSIFTNKSHGHTRKQALALATYGAVTQYASGIRILLDKQPMSKVATALLRPMLEAWINLEYMLIPDNDNNVLLNAHGALIQHRARMERLKEFFTRNKLSEVSGMTTAKIDRVIKQNIKETKEINKMLLSGRVNTIKTLKLHEKAKEVDEHKGYSEPGLSVEYIYRLIHGELSANVHLGFDGLVSWIELKDKELVLNGNEKPEDTKLSLWTAILILKDVSILTLSEFGLHDETYCKKIEDILKRRKEDL